MPVSAKNILKWLYVTLTQSAADAFVQSSISTPFGVDKTVGILRELWIAWPRPAQPAGNSSREFYLTVKSFAAVPVVGTDRSLIFARKRYEEILTSGATLEDDGIEVVKFQDEFAPIMAEATWYAQYDSAATTLTNTCYAKLGYEETTMNDADRFALQAARLAS